MQQLRLKGLQSCLDRAFQAGFSFEGLLFLNHELCNKAVGSSALFLCAGDCGCCDACEIGPRQCISSYVRHIRRFDKNKTEDLSISAVGGELLFYFLLPTS